jgi:bacillithiol biosynthesis deacetylase BshB1
MLDVLAIGAHPDDIELSCGGTIIKLVEGGNRVGIVDLTDGELGTRGTSETRLREAAEAARILGVYVRESLHIRDGRIENSEDNQHRLIRVIRKYRPKLLLFPASADRHPDHVNAHILSRESWFYAGLQKLRTVEEGVSQEPYRPDKYYTYMQWFESIPSFVIDVSAQYEKRTQAVLAFRSQFYNPESTERATALSSPEFLEMLHTRYSYYGDRIGVQYGEPFISPNLIGVNDIRSLI